MLFNALIQIDYQLDETSYLEGLAKALNHYLKTEYVYLEVQPEFCYKLPYCYTYMEDFTKSDNTISENLKARANYLHTFNYRGGYLIIALYATRGIKEDLTPILEHFITFYTLGKIVQDTSIDALTGVTNRTCLSKQLTCKTSLESLIVLDMDNFKSVNDTYGHLVGDSVLEILGTIILNNCSTVYTPYRYGGDEFVIIPEEPVTEVQITDLATRISEQFNSTNVVKTMCLTLSFGIYHESHFKPYPVPICIDIADKALYLSKYLGKNRITVATPSKMLFYDARYKLKELWLSLERTDVTNTLILIKCLDQEVAIRVSQSLASRIRKLDIITQFDKGIFLVFDNEITPATFKCKYKDLLEHDEVSYKYIDIKQVLNYYKLIALMDKELINE